MVGIEKNVPKRLSLKKADPAPSAAWRPQSPQGGLIAANAAPILPAPVAESL
jgi:hypothetical protein